MSSQTQHILGHHMTAVGNNNLQEVLKNYTNESKIITNSGVVTGLNQIEQYFKAVFKEIPAGSTFELVQQIIDGDIAYIIWKSKSEVAEYLFGTDTFVFAAEKIQTQTVAVYKAV